MDQSELINKAFYYLNSFKRHRSLENIERSNGNHEKTNYHQLKQYQFLDNLELAMRAIKKGDKEINGD